MENYSAKLWPYTATTDKSHKHKVKQRKANTEEFILYDSNYIYYTLKCFFQYYMYIPKQAKLTDGVRGENREVLLGEVNKSNGRRGTSGL